MLDTSIPFKLRIDAVAHLIQAYPHWVQTYEGYTMAIGATLKWHDKDFYPWHPRLCRMYGCTLAMKSLEVAN
jgi:hypothetical protein